MAPRKPSKTASNSKKLVKKNTRIDNGLAQALGIPSNNFFGPGAGGNPLSPQISNVNTIFENLRWYVVSNFRQPLSEAYIELGLIQTIVDTPIDDGLRGGIEIQSQQLDEDQIKDLSVNVARENLIHIFGQAGKWNRLYGGAGIIVLVYDQHPETPLDIAKISKKSKIEFKACDMWELYPEDQNVPKILGPNEIVDPLENVHTDFFLYNGHKIHKSRVMKLVNRQAPSFLRPRLRGWGLSEVETLVRSVNQYLKATNLIFSCLDEFKVDIFKIADLVNTLVSPNGEEQVRTRIGLAAQQKNYQNAMVMDSKDDWDHKQISFAGIAETMDSIRMQVASEMHFPITKLFGTSASKGLGNTDQNDMENYNSMVEQVREKLKYNLLTMLEIKCQQMFGFIPDDLEIEFAPLRILSAEQEENVKNSQFARLLQARQAAEIDSKSFLEACNKAHLFPVQIDVSDETVSMIDDPEGNIAIEEKPEESQKETA